MRRDDVSSTADVFLADRSFSVIEEGRGAATLRGATFVAMVQAAHLWKCRDAPNGRNRTRQRVLLNRQMHAP